MANEKPKEQEEKLKELAKKPISKEIAASIKEKQRYINRTITK